MQKFENVDILACLDAVMKQNTGFYQSDFEIDKIVNTFQNKEAVDDFSVAVTYDEIKEKGYSLSAGQYFDIKIDYVDITEEEFNKRMDEYKTTLKAQFEESHRLEEEILKQLDSISFNENVGKEHDDE